MGSCRLWKKGDGRRKNGSYKAVIVSHTERCVCERGARRCHSLRDVGEYCRI